MNKLKILWISHFVPYPPKGGAYQRSYNLLKELSRNNQVYLVCLRHKSSSHPASEISNAVEELGRFCKRVNVVDISKKTTGNALYQFAIKSLLSKHSFTVDLFESREMHELIQTITREVDFDVTHFDTISLIHYIDDVKCHVKGLTHHGIESFMIHRRIRHEPNLLHKVFFWYEASKLLQDEQSYCHHFNVNIVVSALDQEKLQVISPLSKVVAIENGVDVEYFRLNRQSEELGRLVFAGRLDQYSNRDAILYFCTEVWPSVKKRIPEAKFTIIGHNPPERLVKIAENDNAIELMGYVEDIRPYFSKAIACVCPIRDGGGTRLKILDALAMGIPIVSTSIACEGIEVIPEKDLLLANTPEEFVRQIERLASNKKLRSELRFNGRETVERLYSWKSIGAKLDQLYRNLCQRNYIETPA